MTIFLNRDLNHLAVHATLHTLAWCFCGLFSGVFLLRVGLSLPQIYLAFAATLALRCALRPLVLRVAPAIGLRRTLMIGTFLFALPFPLLALVHGVGMALGLVCVLAALGEVFYWTSYHACFAALGDTKTRGSQVAAREVLGALAGIVGPAAGGLVLAEFGPWPAFIAASAIHIAAIVPLAYVGEPVIVRMLPGSLYGTAKSGVWLFVSDGWITATAATAWSVIMFRAAGARFDAFGGLLAAAALAGALSGMVLGRFIDAGHARRLTLVNAVILAASLVLKSICGDEPVAVIAVALGTTMLGGLHIPTLMSALYDEAKAAPCPLHFQFAAEGGWDVGGALSCLAAAALCAADLPLQLAIILALPMVPVQARLLMLSHGRMRGPAKNERRQAPAPAKILSPPQCAGEVEPP
jgi:MFS transporter, DHA1 family, inner membrane transport protein